MKDQQGNGGEKETKFWKIKYESKIKNTVVRGNIINSNNIDNDSDDNDDDIRWRNDDYRGHHVKVDTCLHRQFSYSFSYAEHLLYRTQ